jgi:lipopolysaccharide export LptBFGC system permease protein LptF
LKRRALRIVCGASVLFAALALSHIIHHFFSALEPPLSVGMWASFALATAADVFAFIGGCLLLMGGRR